MPKKTRLIPKGRIGLKSRKSNAAQAAEGKQSMNGVPLGTKIGGGFGSEGTYLTLNSPELYNESAEQQPKSNNDVLKGNAALDILRKQGFTDEELNEIFADEISTGTLYSVGMPTALTKSSAYRNAKQQDLNKQMDTETIPPTDHNQQITMEQSTFMDQVQQDQQDKKEAIKNATTTPINLETAIPGKVDIPKGESTVKAPSFAETAISGKVNVPRVGSTLTADSSTVKIKKSPSVADKFQNSFLGKNADAINAGLGAVSSIAGQFDKDAYEGPKGGVRQGIDQGWNTVADAAAKMGPYGQMVSMGMNAVNAVNSIQNALLGSKGLDNMTTTDAILSSPLGMMIPGLGLINALAGKNADTITKNEEAFAQVGSSYGGSSASVDDALKFSGKRYGAFSSGARQDANALIAESRRQQNLVEDISSEATTRRDLQAGMSSILGNRRAFAMQGGYNQRAVHFGRNGFSLKTITTAKRIISASKFQYGGKIADPFDYYLSTLPKPQRDSTNFRVRDYWEFNGKPKDFNEAISKGMFTQQPDGWHANSVAENPATGEIEFMKSSSHPSHHMEVDWYNSDDGTEFRSQYELQKTEPYWKYVKRKPQGDAVESYRKGGILLELSLSDIPEEYLEPYSIDELSINDIPSEFINNDLLNKVQLDSVLSEFKNGGSIETKEYIPEDIDKLIKFVNSHKKVNFVQRLRDSFRDTIPDWEIEGNVATHKMAYAEDRGKIKVFPLVQEIDGELHDFTDPKYNHGKWDALENAEKNGDIIVFDNEDDAKWFTERYKEYYPTFEKYQAGGKFNVIPEGALHARLHHMENAENLTKKGIPVVSEKKNGELEQQAEIEREEIIFRLEVTKKLEELYKIYYSDNTTNQEKDNAAIEAGKLLTDEILNNTIDNTGLLTTN